MIGVQLIGKDAVLSAFNKFDYEFWGLYEGKTPKIFGQGGDALAEWLELFSQSQSTATYTLRIYDTDALPTSQTGNLDYVASLNFKLVDLYEGHGIAGYNSKLAQRIEGLEKKLSAAEDDDDGEDLNDVLMGWLNNPEKLGMVVGAFRQLVGGGSPAPVVAGNVPQQTISGINTNNSTGGITQDDETKLQRLSVALDKLEKKDPKLIEHLEKLATLDTFIFNAVIQKLDAL